MKLQGSLVFIICCLLIQVTFFTRKRYLYNYTHATARVFISGLQGLMFLVYPLLGHLADVCLTRYRALKWSFITLIGGGALVLLFEILNVSLSSAFNEHFFSHQPYEPTIIIVGIGAILCIVGIGLFEANAIQFGLDQLLEAPTRKLIAFVHWYYWSKNIANLTVIYLAIGFGQVCINSSITAKWACTAVLTAVLLLCILLLGATFFLFCVCKKIFYIQKAGLNPFKNTYRVLKYARKHKVPENRSAFTYWEEDIPPRIDLGKNKYGGPFTTEEVEDTKTFLRILPLLLSLFGFHLTGDGYSATEQFQRTSCPSLPVLLLIVFNPFHMSTLVTAVGIPLYRLVIRKIFPCFRRVLMLTRMWMGLFFCLLQVIFYIILAVNHDTSYWQQHHTVFTPHDVNPTHTCLEIRVGKPHNGSWKTYDDPIDNTYLWFIIPQFLNGLSSLFVSMTALEFICAQAPRTTQGMLIGLLYATFSIRYLVVDILDVFISEWKSWLIYEGVKGFLILVSLVLFSCLSRRYRYRQRDEIVNVQWMIEEIFERRMDQEEEYIRECKALLDERSNNSYSY